MSRKAWLICGGVVLVLGLCAGVVVIGFISLFGWVFAATREAAEAADQFLALVAQDKMAEAYNSSAAGLRVRQSQEAFAADVKRLGLLDYASSSWPVRNIVNDEAKLEGTITTKSGGTIPLTVTLVKEGGTWRVLSLTGTAPVGSGDR
jgi:hypothetical protein